MQFTEEERGLFRATPDAYERAAIFSALRPHLAESALTNVALLINRVYKNPDIPSVYAAMMGIPEATPIAVFRHALATRRAFAQLVAIHDHFERLPTSVRWPGDATGPLLGDASLPGSWQEANLSLEHKVVRMCVRAGLENSENTTRFVNGVMRSVYHLNLYTLRYNLPVDTRPLDMLEHSLGNPDRMKWLWERIVGPAGTSHTQPQAFLVGGFEMVVSMRTESQPPANA